MKISISLECGIRMGKENVREVAALVRSAGFDGIDLSMDRDISVPFCKKEWETAVLAHAEAAKEQGLEILQCHLPFWPGHVDLPGDGTCEAFEAELLPQYTAALELCEKIGCKTAVMHPFISLDSRTLTMEGNVRLLRKLLPVMERCGVRVALENVYASRQGYYLRCAVSDAPGLLELVDRIDSPWVGVCMDTGHANIFGINSAVMARQRGTRLIALHVNGNAGKDEHVIPYTMSDWCELMDYHALSQALKEIGYAGSYNLEVAVGHSSPAAAAAYYQYAAAIARSLADEAE